MGVSQSKQCTLAIVPVKVKVSNSDKVINTHAFLDPGSSATFCTDSLKRKLNITGKNTTILLCTMGQEKNVHSSIVSGLERHIPIQESIDKWKYLREVKIPQLDADIELLIGTNAAKLMEPWKGISLNSKLMQGLNLTSNLVGVLLRFRQEPIALMADVESMFHQAKNILRDLCKLNYAWDKALPDHYIQLWHEWMAGLSCIGELSVNRCLKPKSFDPITSAQLHHFSDASESDYGSELQLALENSIFWTDSTSTLKFIQNENKRFKTFVANRVNTIREMSKVKQWRYINTKQNPADCASCGLKASALLNSKVWLNGPEFLKCQESEWTNSDIAIQTHEEEDDDVEAENAIVRFTQMEAFPEEIETLQKENAYVSHQSHIRRLDPILQDGSLRTGGRLSRMAMPEDRKHPMVLPKHHHVSKLVLKHIHEQLGHCGRNHMLAKLRQQYWIPAAISLARKIRSECVFCRRLHSNLGEQKMADLPKERITPDLPPFTFVGTDFFGSIIVKRGRSEVKRYGVIFTCFTTRAIHLEIANSLDTDSCINAIRRFISRRGQVRQIRSDNGTNLTSADRELKNDIKEWNQSNKLQVALQQKGIEWTYNPPASSHFGGVWERLIKQVKLILYH
ncbi:hypothetical protein PO909_032464 [Leuciscus waleckii]